MNMISNNDIIPGLCFDLPSSVLQPRHILIRPTNVVEFFQRPSSFNTEFPRHISVLVCPRFVGLPLQHSLIWLQQHSFFQLLTLENCCTSLPMDHGGLLQKHLFHVLRTDHSHVHHHLSFKSKVCRCTHLIPTSRASHVTAPAGPLTCFHVCTSRACFRHALRCSRSHLSIHTPSAPEERCHGGYVLQPLNCSPPWQDTDSFRCRKSKE